MAINNTLKDIREERNLIQADLAEAIGSCSQTIGRIERICCRTAFPKCCPHRFYRAGLPARKLSAWRWQGVCAVS